MLEGETKMYRSDGRYSVYIPAGLVKDSAFPFTDKETLTIKIEGNRLLIEKAKKGK